MAPNADSVYKLWCPCVMGKDVETFCVLLFKSLISPIYKGPRSNYQIKIDSSQKRLMFSAVCKNGGYVKSELDSVTK